MNEGLELFRLSGLDERQMGAVLAIAGRWQGSSVPSILANLRASEQDGSSLARNVLATYAQADAALQGIADAARAQRLHAGPGGGKPGRKTEG